MTDNVSETQEKEPVEGRLPLCRAPWQELYILRRGVMPCCHGHAAIAPMGEWKEAWNGPEMQELRRYLKKGELAPYCLQSSACPIVQRVLAAKAEQRQNAANGN